MVTQEIQTVGDLVDSLPAVRRQPAPPVASSAAVTPMQMLSMAVERGADMAILEKLMSLQERWEANEARKAFVVAKSAFKAERPTIIKNKHVGFTSRRTGEETAYDHATIDNVCDTIDPILSKHGLSYSWDIAQRDAQIFVTCILFHEMGHSERVTLNAPPDASGTKSPGQAIASTITFLERYSLLAVTGLATKGQDTDGGTPGEDDAGTITAEQKDALIALIQETGADVKAFLKYIGVASLDEIPEIRFDSAKSALEKKRAKK